MIVKLLVLLLVLCLAACQSPGSQQPTETSSVLPPHATPSAGWASNTETPLSLKVRIPDGWETYNTESGIVLTERTTTPETGVTLEGLLVYIFVPKMDGFSTPAHDANVAWSMLNQVVTNRDYIGDALVSDPVAFLWDKHDAAYYLLNNRDGTLTLLLAIGMPDRRNLVVCHVSMPESHSSRLRPLLPDLLSSLVVNGEAIDGTALHNLPDPLVFPVDEPISARS